MFTQTTRTLQFVACRWPWCRVCTYTFVLWRDGSQCALFPPVKANIGLSSVVNSGFIRGLLWSNTGFGKVKDLPGLGKELSTYKVSVRLSWMLFFFFFFSLFKPPPLSKRQPLIGSTHLYIQPRVIPTTKPGDEASAQTMLPFGPDVLEPQHTQHTSGGGRYYSSADYRALYRSGALSPVDVVEALLPLVQRGQGSIYEKAFLVTHVDEVREAARASAARWAAGTPLGPLDGVPVTIKCDIDVKGYVSTAGINPRLEDDAFGKRYPRLREPATTTDWAAQKLLEAGALLVAQNNMHEMGMDTTGCNVGFFFFILFFYFFLLFAF